MRLAPREFFAKNNSQIASRKLGRAKPLGRAKLRLSRIQIKAKFSPPLNWS